MAEASKPSQQQIEIWKGIANDLETCFNQQSFFADISFVVGKDAETTETIYAHKVILCSRNPVFKAMFHTSGLKEANESLPIVPIKHASPLAFKRMWCTSFGN